MLHRHGIAFSAAMCYNMRRKKRARLHAEKTVTHMKNKFLFPVLALLVAACTGCASDAVSSEIQIPILDGGSAVSYKTAEASYRDIGTSITVGGNIGYVYGDTLSIEYDTNVVSVNASFGDRLKEGDIIAVFNSSSLDREYNDQKALTDSAYNRYASSGGEALRLEYETQAQMLELVQSKINSYTIRAPYDCIVSSVTRFEEGAAVTAGTPVCTVAKEGEVFVTVSDHKEAFRLGKHVKLKFGTSDEYSGTVVMMPEKDADRNDPVSGSVVIKFDSGEYERAAEKLGNVAAGGWASVIVETLSLNNVLCIPSEAVLQYSGAAYCYIEKNGERARLLIETGDTAGGYTVVLNGLSEGDRVSYR